MSPPTREKNSQKTARLVRLMSEVKRFAFSNTGCSAQLIVAFLSLDKNMRNHGLTPRKIGPFIPRYLRQDVTWWHDHRAGRSVYGPVQDETTAS